jgi:hypothetical protein
MSMELTAELHFLYIIQLYIATAALLSHLLGKICWNVDDDEITAHRDCMRFIAVKIKCNFAVNWGENAWRGSNEWARRREHNTYWGMTLNYIKSLHKMFQSLKINLSPFVAVQHVWWNFSDDLYKERGRFVSDFQ